MVPRRRKYRDKLITQAFFAQAQSNEKPFQYPPHVCCTDRDPEHGQKDGKVPNKELDDWIIPVPNSERKEVEALKWYVAKGENPIIWQEIREIYRTAGAVLGLYYTESHNKGKESNGFKVSRFTEEIDADCEEGEHGSSDVDGGPMRANGEVEVDVMEGRTVSTEFVAPVTKKKKRRGRRRRKGKQPAGFSGLEKFNCNVDATEGPEAMEIEDSVDASHDDYSGMVDNGCDVRSKSVYSTEAAEGVQNGQHWRYAEPIPQENGNEAIGENNATFRDVKQKKKRRRKRKNRPTQRSLDKKQDTNTVAMAVGEGTLTEEDGWKEPGSQIAPVDNRKHNSSAIKIESQAVLNGLAVTSDNLDTFIAHYAQQKDMVGDFLQEKKPKEARQTGRESRSSFHHKIIPVEESVQVKSERLQKSICFAIREIRLFNMEKRWGLVEEQTARFEREHRQLLGEGGNELFPWSLREVLDDPRLVLQSMKSLDGQPKAARFVGKEAAMDVERWKRLAANAIESMDAPERPIVPKGPKPPTFFHDLIPQGTPTKMQEKMLDLELMLSEISSAQDLLLRMRDEVGQLAMSWAAASWQVWELGKKYWRDLPVMVKYDYHRAELLAMYEHAKLLDCQVVGYFASNAGRSHLTPILSTILRLDKYSRKDGACIEQQWDQRITRLRLVLPTVAYILGRVDRIFQQSVIPGKARDESTDEW
ncbi:MAG: hypothetical protein Q9217_006690 [Psora testacea]